MKKSLITRIIPVLSLLVLMFAITNCGKKEIKDEAVEVAQEVPLLTYTLQGKRGLVTHYKRGEILPFENAYLPNPPQSVYSGNLFELRHDYPQTTPSPGDYPWKKVTNNGLITQQNSYAYVEALKAYVADDMQKLLYDYQNWDPQQESWYQSIWLGNVREPIHGMYVGSEFPAGSLGPDQTGGLTTYVYTLYDQTAAVTLYRIWGQDSLNAYRPNLTNTADAQYAEGSVIVKFAFVSLSETWTPMENTATWDVYTDVDPTKGSPGTSDTTLRTLQLMQFDIIVKDTEAAPQTGWVFSTLVYDKDAVGNTAWDRMVPLGATWGGNPDVINTSPEAIGVPAKVNQALTENWINMASPSYARSTLGWDGRISGPNDGAVVTPATTQNGDKYQAPTGLSTAGCIACHSSAQYPMKSFLLPAVHIPGPNVPLVMYDPGSEGWMKWFSNRSGTEPIDSGQVSLDYDMVTAFKAIPSWEKAIENK